jgi:hypothetical protein
VLEHQQRIEKGEREIVSGERAFFESSSVFTTNAQLAKKKE